MEKLSENREFTPGGRIKLTEYFKGGNTGLWGNIEIINGFTGTETKKVSFITLPIGRIKVNE